jgi:DNA-directed RNA polymerase specialized sigma24 family protein
MTTTEVLAVSHLRRWAHDRIRVRSPRTTAYKRHGWDQRNAANFDASIVRVIDFERALARLTPRDQTILVLMYRDRLAAPAIAIAAGCSTATVDHTVRRARVALAEELDRAGIL